MSEEMPNFKKLNKNKSDFQILEQGNPTEEEIKAEKENKINALKEKIQKAIEIHNSEEVKENLQKLTEGVENLDPENLKKLSGYLRGLSMTAVEKEDKEIFGIVIEKLGEVGNVSLKRVRKEEGRKDEKTEEEFESIIKQTAISLEDISEFSANKNFENGTEQAIEILGGIGQVAVENNAKGAICEIIACIEDAGKNAANFGKKFEEATVEAGMCLKDIGVDAAKKSAEKKELEVIPDAVASSLNIIGKIAKEKKFSKALELSKAFLSEVIEESDNQGLDVMTRTIGGK